MHKPAHEVAALVGTWEHCLPMNNRRPIALAVPFGRAWSDHSQRGAARVSGNRARCTSSLETASAVAHTRYTRKPTREVDAAAGTWELDRAPKKGGILLVQCPSIGHAVTTTGAVRGARVRQAHVLRRLPKER